MFTQVNRCGATQIHAYGSTLDDPHGEVITLFREIARAGRNETTRGAAAHLRSPHDWTRALCTG